MQRSSLKNVYQITCEVKIMESQFRNSNLIHRITELITGKGMDALLVQGSFHCMILRVALLIS